MGVRSQKNQIESKLGQNHKKGNEKSKAAPRCYTDAIPDDLRAPIFLFTQPEHRFAHHY